MYVDMVMIMNMGSQDRDFGCEWIDKTHLETVYKTYYFQNQNGPNRAMSFSLPASRTPTKQK